MRIVLTGGTGYLGSRLAERLVKSGHEVGCIVRDSARLRYLEPCRQQVCLIPVETMEEGIGAFRPSAVVHTACTYSGGGRSEYAVFEGNLLFPFRVMQCALGAGVCRWVNADTCLPHMLNSYALSKDQLRQWGRYYVAQGKLQFTNLRLEYFYGKDAPEKHFLSWVIQKLRRNAPIDLTVGIQRRDLIRVEDVAAVFQAVLERGETEEEIPVGTGTAPTIRDVVEYLKHELGSSSQLYFGAVPTRPGEPDSHCDTSKLKDLGLSEPMGWRAGLKLLAESVQQEGKL